MARLQAEVDGQRSAQSTVSLGYTLDEWLGTVELEDSTRDTYVGFIERSIRPTLGGVVLRRAAAMPDALQRAPVHRAPSRRAMTAPRLDAHRMSAARWRPRPFGRSTPSSAVR
jgi:hypothetical protein